MDRRNFEAILSSSECPLSCPQDQVELEKLQMVITAFRQLHKVLKEEKSSLVPDQLAESGDLQRGKVICHFHQVTATLP